MEITWKTIIAFCLVAVVMLNGLFSESNYNGKVTRWLYKISFSLFAAKGMWMICQALGLVAG